MTNFHLIFAFLNELTVVFLSLLLMFTWQVKLRFLYRCTFHIHVRLTFLALSSETVTSSGATMYTGTKQ